MSSGPSITGPSLSCRFNASTGMGSPSDSASSVTLKPSSSNDRDNPTSGVDAKPLRNRVWDSAIQHAPSPTPDKTSITRGSTDSRALSSSIEPELA